MFSILLLFPLIVMSSIPGAWALNPKKIAEYYSCDKLTVDPHLDAAWMKSVRLWYTTLWNQVDLYNTMQNIVGKRAFEEFSEEDLDKACVYYAVNGTQTPVYAFGREVPLPYETTDDPYRKGVTYWAVKKERGGYDFIATTYITKTDNKSYMVENTMWWNGMKGFNVGSTEPQLDERTLQEIKDHLVALGYKPKHFVQQDYEGCAPPPIGATGRRPIRCFTNFV